MKVDLAFEDGQLLPMLGGIRVIDTPGHTEGSSCFYLQEKKLLIVGDALQYRFRRLGFPYRWTTKNPKQARESIQKLVPHDFELICSSHFPPVRRNARPSLLRLAQRGASVHTEGQEQGQVRPGFAKGAGDPYMEPGTPA